MEISEDDIKDICRLTGEKRKGPALRKFILDALMLKRRAETMQKVISGEWGFELNGIEESQAADHKADCIGARSGRKRCRWLEMEVE